MISISLFVNVLKMTLKFKNRDIEFDIVPVNEIKFQIKNFFDLTRKNFIF